MWRLLKIKKDYYKWGKVEGVEDGLSFKVISNKYLLKNDE